jgi:hypothetical protein
MPAAPHPARPLRADAAVLAVFAFPILLTFNLLAGNQYGFHRDELQFLDDARHLHWGFVAYPPLTAFAGRLAIALIGISPKIFRLPAALTNAVSLILAGLIARELGGRRAAQILTLFACLPLAIAFSSVLQYNTFDLFAWSLTVFFTARLLRTHDPRNWIGVGAGLGIGVLSKYSIAFLALSLLAGFVALPSARQRLGSRWFVFGVLAGTLIAAPNLIWLVSHHFITLQMEHFIHARDIRNGRTDGYYTDQLKYTLLALPLALTGLVSLLRSQRFRVLAVVYLGPFILFAIAKGRGYYLLPAYPVLYAAGAVVLEQFLTARPIALRISIRTLAFAAMLADAALITTAFIPIFGPGTPAFARQLANSSDLSDEVGWPEFVASVAAVRDTLPPEDRTRLGILANNYGEAGALALYGPQYNLPTPISSTNSFHDRGYGTDPAGPETVIVTGDTLSNQLKNFERCTVSGQVHIPFNVRNEESMYHADILVCHHLRHPWPEVWSHSQEFG